MVDPLMIKDAIFIPKSLSIIGICLLILLGRKEHARRHVGRLGIVGNSLFLWQVFYNAWASLPNWMAWYLNLGTIFGGIALLTYLSRDSLPTEYYNVALWLYGSFSVLIVLLMAVAYSIPIF